MSDIIPYLTFSVSFPDKIRCLILRSTKNVCENIWHSMWSCKYHLVALCSFVYFFADSVKHFCKSVLFVWRTLEGAPHLNSCNRYVLTFEWMPHREGNDVMTCFRYHDNKASLTCQNLHNCVVLVALSPLIFDVPKKRNYLQDYNTGIWS